MVTSGPPGQGGGFDAFGQLADLARDARGRKVTPEEQVRGSYSGVRQTTEEYESTIAAYEELNRRREEERSRKAQQLASLGGALEPLAEPAFEALRGLVPGAGLVDRMQKHDIPGQILGRQLPEPGQEVGDIPVLTEMVEQISDFTGADPLRDMFTRAQPRASDLAGGEWGALEETLATRKRMKDAKTFGHPEAAVKDWEDFKKTPRIARLIREYPDVAEPALKRRKQAAMSRTYIPSTSDYERAIEEAEAITDIASDLLLAKRLRTGEEAYNPSQLVDSTKLDAVTGWSAVAKAVPPQWWVDAALVTRFGYTDTEGLRTRLSGLYHTWNNRDTVSATDTKKRENIQSALKEIIATALLPFARKSIKKVGSVLGRSEEDTALEQEIPVRSAKEKASWQLLFHVFELVPMSVWDGITWRDRDTGRPILPIADDDFSEVMVELKRWMPEAYDVAAKSNLGPEAFDELQNSLSSVVLDVVMPAALYDIPYTRRIKEKLRTRGWSGTSTPLIDVGDMELFENYWGSLEQLMGRLSASPQDLPSMGSHVPQILKVLNSTVGFTKANTKLATVEAIHEMINKATDEAGTNNLWDIVQSNVDAGGASVYLWMVFWLQAAETSSRAAAGTALSVAAPVVEAAGKGLGVKALEEFGVAAKKQAEVEHREVSRVVKGVPDMVRHMLHYYADYFDGRIARGRAVWQLPFLLNDAFMAWNFGVRKIASYSTRGAGKVFVYGAKKWTRRKHLKERARRAAEHPDVQAGREARARKQWIVRPGETEPRQLTSELHVTRRPPPDEVYPPRDPGPEIIDIEPLSPRKHIQPERAMGEVPVSEGQLIAFGKRIERAGESFDKRADAIMTELNKSLLYYAAGESPMGVISAGSVAAGLGQLYGRKDLDKGFKTIIYQSEADSKAWFTMWFESWREVLDAYQNYNVPLPEYLTTWIAHRIARRSVLKEGLPIPGGEVKARVGFGKFTKEWASDTFGVADEERIALGILKTVEQRIDKLRKSHKGKDPPELQELIANWKKKGLKGKPPRKNLLKKYWYQKKVDLFADIAVQVMPPELIRRGVPEYLAELLGGKEHELTFQHMADEAYDQTYIVKKDGKDIHISRGDYALAWKNPENTKAIKAMVLKTVYGRVSPQEAAENIYEIGGNELLRPDHADADESGFITTKKIHLNAMDLGLVRPAGNHSTFVLPTKEAENILKGTHGDEFPLQYDQSNTMHLYVMVNAMVDFFYQGEGPLIRCLPLAKAPSQTLEMPRTISMAPPVVAPGREGVIPFRGVAPLYEHPTRGEFSGYTQKAYAEDPLLGSFLEKAYGIGAGILVFPRTKMAAIAPSGYSPTAISLLKGHNGNEFDVPELKAWVEDNLSEWSVEFFDDGVVEGYLIRHEDGHLMTEAEKKAVLDRLEDEGVELPVFQDMSFGGKNFLDSPQGYVYDLREHSLGKTLYAFEGKDLLPAIKKLDQRYFDDAKFYKKMRDLQVAFRTSEVKNRPHAALVVVLKSLSTESLQAFTAFLDTGELPTTAMWSPGMVDEWAQKGLYDPETKLPTAAGLATSLINARVRDKYWKNFLFRTWMAHTNHLGGPVRRMLNVKEWMPAEIAALAGPMLSFVHDFRSKMALTFRELHDLGLYQGDDQAINALEYFHTLYQGTHDIRPFFTPLHTKTGKRTEQKKRSLLELDPDQQAALMAEKGVSPITNIVLQYMMTGAAITSSVGRIKVLMEAERRGFVVEGVKNLTTGVYEAPGRPSEWMRMTDEIVGVDGFDTIAPTLGYMTDGTRFITRKYGELLLGEKEREKGMLARYAGREKVVSEIEPGYKWRMVKTLPDIIIEGLVKSFDATAWVADRINSSGWNAWRKANWLVRGLTGSIMRNFGFTALSVGLHRPELLIHETFWWDIKTGYAVLTRGRLAPKGTLEGQAQRMVIKSGAIDRAEHLTELGITGPAAIAVGEAASRWAENTLREANERKDRKKIISEEAAAAIFSNFAEANHDKMVAELFFDERIGIRETFIERVESAPAIVTTQRGAVAHLFQDVLDYKLGLDIIRSGVSGALSAAKQQRLEEFWKGRNVIAKDRFTRFGFLLFTLGDELMRYAILMDVARKAIAKGHGIDSPDQPKAVEYFEAAEEVVPSYADLNIPTRILRGFWEPFIVFPFKQMAIMWWATVKKPFQAAVYRLGAEYVLASRLEDEEKLAAWFGRGPGEHSVIPSGLGSAVDPRSQMASIDLSIFTNPSTSANIELLARVFGPAMAAHGMDPIFKVKENDLKKWRLLKGSLLYEEMVNGFVETSFGAAQMNAASWGMRLMRDYPHLGGGKPFFEPVLSPDKVRSREASGERNVFALGEDEASAQAAWEVARERDPGRTQLAQHWFPHGGALYRREKARKYEYPYGRLQVQTFQDMMYRYVLGLSMAPPVTKESYDRYQQLREATVNAYKRLLRLDRRKAQLRALGVKPSPQDVEAAKEAKRELEEYLEGPGQIIPRGYARSLPRGIINALRVILKGRQDFSNDPEYRDLMWLFGLAKKADKQDIERDTNKGIRRTP